MAYNRRYRVSRRNTSRWMTLRYAGKCKVCQRALQAGERAYWDQAARTITCTDIDCARADGLTEVKSPTGPWDKWESHDVLAPKRIIVSTFNSGESAWVNANGRCEDAPCCGCCS